MDTLSTEYKLVRRRYALPVTYVPLSAIKTALDQLDDMSTDPIPALINVLWHGETVMVPMNIYRLVDDRVIIARYNQTSALPRPMQQRPGHNDLELVFGRFMIAHNQNGWVLYGSYQEPVPV